MKNIFQQIPSNPVRYNRFDLTHDVKLSTDFGRLTPICLMECLPGDKWNIQGSAFVRLAPTIAPVMDRADVYIHYFFVPNRIVWRNFEFFISPEDGEDTIVAPFMTVDTDDLDIGRLGDYLGLPTNADVGSGISTVVSPIPFAAYQKVYDDYYRDQNLEDKVFTELSDGDNTADFTALAQIRNRAWSKDYFTSALPFPQRGPDVFLPLQGTADLEIITGNDPIIQQWKEVTSPYNAANSGTDPDGIDFSSSNSSRTISNANPGYFMFLDVAQSHRVDLSTASAATITELRRAMQLQRFLEMSAVGGGRYIEQMRMMFGVVSDDARLQRPEYIGGFSSPIKMSEVLQTSPPTSEATTSPQGNMAGHGVSIGASKINSYHCKEHGYIIGIMSVIPKSGYQQGVERHWTRFDRFDYAWPQFAHIGEQAVLNKEIYLRGTSEDIETWAYQMRFSEYKFMNNRVAGDFRDTLAFWHMSRKFSSFPALNNNFVKVTPADVDRVFAVQGTPDTTRLWCQVLNKVKVNRALPVFSTPGGIM